MICGSVKIDASSSNNTSTRQYISFIKVEIDNLLKQSKLYVNVITLDAKSTITDNLKIVHDRLKKLNKNINTRTDNEEIINMLKRIKTQVDFNYIQLSELKKYIDLIF